MGRLKLRLMVALLICVFSLSARAGWVSAGGGELFGDAHNPWFLKNVSQVNYCVNVAPGSVSSDAGTVRATVKESLDYWKAEFSRAAQGLAPGQLSLATQTFSELPCTDPSVALSILVGYETLSAEQINGLGNPLNYIGVAIRTDYDSSLRGRGFIFIASDIGPRSYHGGTDETLISGAWRKPNLLKYALLHELGHVFGMPHTGSGLMSEAFLEQMLSKALADDFVKTPIPTFFGVGDELELCSCLGFSSAILPFFGAAADQTCLHLSKKTPTQFTVSSRKDSSPASPATELGTLTAASLEVGDFQTRPTIVLQLMGNTTVFTPQETMFRSFMFGPMFADYGMQGNFVPRSGQSKPVYAKFTPDSFVVQGIYGGKIQAVLSFNSPIGILLLQNPTPHLNRGE